MTRSQILLPLVCLLALGAALFFRLNPQEVKNPAAQITLSATTPVAAPAPKAASSRTIDKAVSWAEGDRPEAPALPESVLDTQTLTASSWENPFRPELWKSSGWQFSLPGMQTIGTGSCFATFGRPYQKLMLECDILTDSADAGSWELRLATPDSSSVMSFILHDHRIMVQTVEHGLKTVVMEKPLTRHLSRDVPRQFRIVATGNRIVVSWDGRRLLTTEQLASQSGRNVIWSMQSSGAAFRIPRLRVEGD